MQACGGGGGGGVGISTYAHTLPIAGTTVQGMSYVQFIRMWTCVNVVGSVLPQDKDGALSVEEQEVSVHTRLCTHMHNIHTHTNTRTHEHTHRNTYTHRDTQTWIHTHCCSLPPPPPPPPSCSPRSVPSGHAGSVSRVPLGSPADCPHCWDQ